MWIVMKERRSHVATLPVERIAQLAVGKSGSLNADGIL